MMSARILMTLRSIPAGRILAGRSFATTSRMTLKESSSQTNADYEKHKQDSLKKQKEGFGHWKPELASDSEEAIRADRSTDKGPEEACKLQERTKRAAEESAKAGTSVRDNM